MDMHDKVVIVTGGASGIGRALCERLAQEGARGEVVADGILQVGPEADVHARIEVDVLVVEGLVAGEVVARERVEVLATGRITAAVRTPRLVLAEGGRIEGRLEMGTKKAPAAPSPTSASAA